MNRRLFIVAGALIFGAACGGHLETGSTSSVNGAAGKGAGAVDSGGGGGPGLVDSGVTTIDSSVTTSGSGGATGDAGQNMDAAGGSPGSITPIYGQFSSMPSPNPSCIPKTRFAAREGYLSTIAFAPDGKTFASGLGSSTPNVHLWDSISGSLIREFEGHGLSTYSVAFSPDGALLATAGDSAFENQPDSVPRPDVVKVWDPRTGKLIRALPATCGRYAHSVEFSHKGDLLVSSGLTGFIEIWRSTDGALVRRIVHPETTVYSVRFSPDDLLLVSAGYDGSARVWRVSDGQQLHALPGHTAPVADAVFSPDALEIATVADDQTLRIFATDGSPLQALPSLLPNGGGGRVLWLDRDRIVTNEGLGGVVVWARGKDGFARSCGVSLPAMGEALASNAQGSTILWAGEGVWELSF